MGINNPELTADPSIAIGSQPATVEDMASAYGVFAADGVRHPEVFVTRVTDRNGRVLYEAHPAPKQVLPTDIARTVTGVLQQVVQRGTGVNARIGRPAAGKTGSAEDNTDAWFVGYTPELVAAVWVGDPRVDVIAMRPPRHADHRARRHVPRADLAGLRVERARDGPGVDLPGTGGQHDHHHDPAAAAPPRARSRPASTRSSACTCSRRSRRCTQDGYQVEVVRAPSRRYPPNYVTAQDPPGRQPGAARARTVTLTVANGRPRVVSVPSVLGLPADQAVAAIRAAGLVPDLVVEVQPDPVPPDSQGKVWKQSPVSRPAVDEGSTVTIDANP